MEAGRSERQLEPVENWDQVRDVNGAGHIRPWSNTHRMPDPLGSFVPQWGKLSGIQNNSRLEERKWEAPAAFNDAQDIILTSTDLGRPKVGLSRCAGHLDGRSTGHDAYNPLETYAMRKDITWKPYGLYYMDLRPYNLQFAE